MTSAIALGLAAGNRRMLNAQRLTSPRRVNLAARTGYNSRNTLANGTFNSMNIRIPFWVSPDADFTDIEFVLGNFGAGLSVVNSDSAPNPVTITGAAIERPGGVINPLFFPNGTRSVVIPPGGSISNLPAPVNLLKGTQFWFRAKVDEPVAGAFWQSEYLFVNNGGIATNTGALGTPVADLSLSGTIANSNVQREVFPPIMVLGTPLAGASPRSIGIMSDSIGVGTGDADTTRDVGWMCKGLKLNYAYAHFGQASYSMSLQDPSGNTQALARKFTRDLMLRGSTHVISNLGTNDISPGTNRTTAQVQALMTGIAVECAARGIKFIPCTLLPRTDGANSGGFAGTDTQVQRDRINEINAWIRTDPFGNGFFDAHSFAAMPGSPHRWRADLGTPCDAAGVHPTTAVANAIAAGFEAALPNLIR